MQRRVRKMGLAALILSVLYAGRASAHIALTSPKPRYADQKAGPCGKGTRDARTGNVARFKPGETITVTWRETIGHPGHFRIAFVEDGTAGLVDPKGFDDRSGGPNVLVDGIADKPQNGTYSQVVTLPDVACTNCTLQLIQVMTDKPPYGDGNDIYYQCADIVLATEEPIDAGAVEGGTIPSPAPAVAEGCAIVGPTATSGPFSAALLALGLYGARRRRSGVNGSARSRGRRERAIRA